MKYLLLSVDDAHLISEVVLLDYSPVLGGAFKIAMSLKADEGGDFEEIASQLKSTEICIACSIEGQQHTCVAPESQKIGRRLQRLIERAKVRQAGAMTAEARKE